MMDKDWQKALKEYHQKLRSGLLVVNVLPALRPYDYLTDVEYTQVASKQVQGNVAQVDELVEILLTKEKRNFDGLCHVLERNGYLHWAQQLRAAVGGRKEEAKGRQAVSENVTIINCVKFHVYILLGA